MTSRDRVERFRQRFDADTAPCITRVTSRRATLGWRLEDELVEIERVVRAGGVALHLGLPHPPSVTDPRHQRLTEAGYVGEDVENIILRLLQNADYDVARAEKGIVYIDEIEFRGYSD